MQQTWKTIIRPKTRWNDIKLKELLEYKDLIFLFVKRNFTTRYKQTVLGPAWLIIVPLVNTFISTFVFGTIAGIPSDGVPYFLFHLCGNGLAWSYFSSCLTSTSSTFTANASIFGKVYFPRLVVPISIVITGLIDFAVHFILFVGFWCYFRYNGADIHITWFVWVIPILVVQMAALGLGCGIIISSLTTKYRDLTVLVGFGVSLWMYVSPIIYSTDSLSPRLYCICMLNPMAPVVEMFRYALLGAGDVSFGYWAVSLCTTVIVLFIGVVLFSKVERTFMDTV